MHRCYITNTQNKCILYQCNGEPFYLSNNIIMQPTFSQLFPFPCRYTWFITCYTGANCSYISGFCDICVLQSNQSWLLYSSITVICPSQNVLMLRNFLIYWCEAFEISSFLLIVNGIGVAVWSSYVQNALVSLSLSFKG